MNLQHRIDLLTRLGEYILSDDPEWNAAKINAGRENAWFIPEFVDLAIKNIARYYLNKEALENWIGKYNLSAPNGKNVKTIGVVMAGNIPLVGFHDWLSIFISGHKSLIKTSSKDKILIPFLTKKMAEWEPCVTEKIVFSEMLKGCDAYIATGSNNSSRYFEFYFSKYPHIIRRNRTSVAIIEGTESQEELSKLADDIYQYFGLGCRNVTKIYVPADYDFSPLLSAFKKYDYLKDHHKYKNNFDYNLAILLLNKEKYMTNGSVLLVENSSMFSPVSQVNFEIYDDKKKLLDSLQKNEEIQCVVDNEQVLFGEAQRPRLSDFADGKDTLDFLTNF